MGTRIPIHAPKPPRTRLKPLTPKYQAVLNAQLEEYRTLRKEIDDGIKQRFQIAGLGLAAIGVLLAAIPASGAQDKSFYLYVFVIIYSVAVIGCYYAVSKRVRRAGWHLYCLEKRINRTLGGGKVLSWEIELRENKKDPRYKLFNLHHVFVLTLFYIIACLSFRQLLSLKWNILCFNTQNLVDLIIYFAICAAVYLILWQRMKITLEPYDQP